MRKTVYTNATITNSASNSNIVHVDTQDTGGSVIVVFTHDEFTSRLKQWLRTMPAEQRQMVIDELVACTLRTLE